MKDYKKILEGVVNIINTTEKSDIGFANICTYIGENCPELKSEDERIRKALIYHYQGDGFLCTNGYRIDYKDIRAWLKKQGEQKSLDDITKEVTKDKDAATSFLKSTGIINENGELADEYKIEQGEKKPADKVEPKFKAGDWIVSNEHPNCSNSLMMIVEVGLTDYLCRYCNRQITYCREFIDKEYRLWTIQDAKDGDVLVTHSGIVFIFKNIMECGTISFHAALSTPNFASNTKIHIPEDNEQLGDQEVFPATKEQRDILFQKMKEACYEWDDEKKELKKNEPMPTAEGMKLISRTKCEFAEWSEEDEKMLNKLLAVVTLYYGYNGNVLDKQSCTSFLKSLKERVQTKQEWSEEDEKMWAQVINEIKAIKSNSSTIFEKNIAQDKIDWLKSLKDRYTWKPSDEQMEALWNVYRGGKEQAELATLYNDLKKLREK